MNIFLPFKNRGIGGTVTFAHKFKEGMEKKGHNVFFEYQPDYDVLFLVVQAPFKYLQDAKRHHKKIIQRLDGVYYWSVASWKYPLFNAKARIIRHAFTDFTIYQSNYSQYCVEKFLGKKHEKSTVIYNGVDLELFSPIGPKKLVRENPAQQLLFTASAFRREDQIIPMLEALKIYEKKYTGNFKLYIAGTFTKKLEYIPKKYTYFKNIQFLGRIENHELPAYERSADVFLFTHLNPPCPNNVIEAMACGLPICGVADGAMAELVTSGKEGILLPTTGDAFTTPRSLNLEAMADNINRLMQDRSTYARAANVRAQKDFGLDFMTKEYINSLQNIAHFKH